jgi:predicted naringenin-chalcone synthase
MTVRDWYFAYTGVFVILYDFEHVRPQFEIPQVEILAWLAQAHTRAENLLNSEKGTRDSDPVGAEDDEVFQRRMEALLRRYGCGPAMIGTRGAEIGDFTHLDWERMELFSLKSSPKGPGMSERTAFFQKATRRVCERLLPAAKTAPEHLIHVTCTGYLSPSCAQEAVNNNDWNAQTTVTHAYHMGCHAAMPAIRMAMGFLALRRRRPAHVGIPANQTTAAVPSEPRHPGSKRVDILHTEICSAHFLPSDHSPEQLVVQSLFGDGFIRYSARSFRRKNAGRGSGDLPAKRRRRGLKVMALHETIVPSSRDAVTWECADWGMKMGLQRDVPELITVGLPTFLEELYRRGGVASREMAAKAVFAVHPGGPKIINRIQELEGLAPDQLFFSREILRKFGNMSSATLPHVWETIVAEPTIPAGTPVISLAFGPGLSISGAMMEVVG